jgi:hypothetical protein
MSGGRRGGERRRHAPEAHAPAHAREIVACARQYASFTRSFDPCGVILARARANDPASRLGKPTQVGGTSTGVGRTDAARLAARRRSCQGSSLDASDKEGGRGLRPCEDQEPEGWFARTSCFSCRSRQATSGLEYARHTRSQKSGQGRVNGGLARSDDRRVKPSVGAPGEGDIARRASPA